MTSEIRTAFELSDIAGIEIECRECHASILYPTDERNQERVVAQCPNCGVRLFVITRTAAGEGSVTIEQLKSLMRTLKLLAAPSTEEHAHIRIQVKPVSQK